MGLDMYAYITDKNNVGEQRIVERPLTEKPVLEELMYWRKHHDLHGFMEGLYREAGGTESFNCIKLQLFGKDLDRLEKAILQRRLPQTTGFFFGDNPPDDESDNEDLEFIRRARQALRDGKAVLYDSWW